MWSCRSRPNPAALTACATVALTLPATDGVAQEQPPGTVPDGPEFATVWIGEPLASLYTSEMARLREVCEPTEPACFETELDTAGVALAPVRGSPGGDTVGHLVAALRPRGRYPFTTLLFQSMEGSRIVVREDVGDWGYGITLPLADRADGWIRLLAPHAEVPLWVPTSAGGPGFGVVEVFGLPGRLWRLGPVSGAGPEGDRVTVPEAVYYVLEVSDGMVRLRPEVPADMPCGEEPTAEPAAEAGTVPEYSIPLEVLTAPDGRLAVEPAYPKGC